MILTLYIIIQILMLGIFFTAFFTKQEVLWALSVMLSGVLMFSSYSIQIARYVFDESIGAYVFELGSHSFPFMMGINMLFFALGLIFGLFDIFSNYGISTGIFSKKVK